jgi:integrase/recombinase XerD
VSARSPQDTHGLAGALARYIEHLGVRGYRPQGMATAERYIGEFIAWASERGVLHPAQVSRAVLERYERFLFHYRKRDGNPLSIASRRCKLVPLRGFFRWLTRAGHIPANPAADLELPRRLKRLPRVVLTVGEVERVMACVDLGTPVGLRDRAMLEILYATGIRRNELACLQIGDVDTDRAVLLIREGKGGKDRLVPLGERALHWVREWLDRGRPQIAWDQADATLFLGNEGKPMTPVWLSTVISKRVEAAGLGKKGGCHLFRHTMATLMLEGGADIRHIQAMLGHAEISTTQIYTQVAIRQLAQVHAMTHPGARRRVRGQAAQEAIQGAQLRLDLHLPYLDAETSSEALLDALDAEADEEAVQADAPPARR